MRKARWIVGILVILLAFLLWWSIASNYDYGSLAGTYVLRNGKITCALHLRTDQTYTEQLTTKTGIQKANGNWRRFGEAGVEFSSPFLKVPGQQSGPSGKNYGHFDKTLGVFPNLTLDPETGGPRFHRTISSFLER